MPAYKQVTFVARPGRGVFDPAKTFRVEEHEIPGADSIPDGSVLVRNEWTSCDPAMRGWMNDARSYVKPLAIGEVMRAETVGTIAVSKCQGFAKGDHVIGTLGWTEYKVVSQPNKTLRKVSGDVPVRWYLNVLGMVAQTAYWGILDVGKIQSGETVVISGAAGATGLIACQIARLKGCKVVAIAGGKEKCAWLEKNLAVKAIDYKSPDFRNAFKEATPDYVNVFFDNVGGDILNLVLTRLALRARIVICGAISQYNATSANAQGPSNYLTLISQRATMQGFIVFDYAKRYSEAAEELTRWIKEGKLRAFETVVQGGVEAAPQALLDLFQGKNTGKMIVQIAKSSSL